MWQSLPIIECHMGAQSPYFLWEKLEKINKIGHTHTMASLLAVDGLWTLVCFHLLMISYHLCQLSPLLLHWQYWVLRVLWCYHLHPSPLQLLVPVQLWEQLWYWLAVILERVCCWCQINLCVLKLEFIEMYELLPEIWLRDKEEGGKGLVGLHCRNSVLVTNILQ